LNNFHRKKKETSDFALLNEVDLCTMHNADDDCVEGKRFSVVIDQSVVQGIMDHAYADPKNEILGHLGGIVDEHENKFHITIFTACSRVLDELAPDSVEAYPEKTV